MHKNPSFYHLSMKRASRISEFRACLIRPRFSLSNAHERIADPSVPIRFICQDATQTPSRDEIETKRVNLSSLFKDKLMYNGAPLKKISYNPAEAILAEELKEKVADLRNEIVAHKQDVEKIEKVLEEKGVDLFRRYSDGSAIVQLLNQLRCFPSLAIEVIGWRRKQLDYAAPMTVEEYSKAIAIAGRMNDLDVSVELFKEAYNKQLKGTCLFNALMTAYRRSGLAMKCQSVFQDLKRESTCAPTIVTYNILISLYGGMMLVDHMKEAFKEMHDLNFAPTIHTYRGLMTGYITAWMWEEMEKTYLVMKDGPVKPDLSIYLLMLRGYAISGKLEKMEEIYDMVSYHVDKEGIQFLILMIHAYCKSSNAARVQKVEELLRKIPKNNYRPGLNVVLICLYANEDLLEKMENSINEAFERKAYVTAVNVMKCIVSSYFRHNAVDMLADFARRAEIAGWKLCRSVYHAKMVMYASEMRLSEMEKVLYEMARVNMHVSNKTLWILYYAYTKWGERSKLEQVIGVMYKNGCMLRHGA